MTTTATSRARLFSDAETGIRACEPFFRAPRLECTRTHHQTVGERESGREFWDGEGTAAVSPIGHAEIILLFALTRILIEDR